MDSSEEEFIRIEAEIKAAIKEIQKYGTDRQAAKDSRDPNPGAATRYYASRYGAGYGTWNGAQHHTWTSGGTNEGTGMRLWNRDKSVAAPIYAPLHGYTPAMQYQPMTWETRELEQRLIPVVKDTPPILATRYARLGVTNNKLKFTAMIDKYGTFNAEDEAECKRVTPSSGMFGPTHHRSDVPSPECSCGFYAVPADKLPSHMTNENMLTLQVELSGRVIEHEEGYRAQHQRVLAAQVERCLCGEKSTRVWLGLAGGMGKDCGEHYYITGSTFMSFTLPQLSKALGVPFSSK